VRRDHMQAKGSGAVGRGMHVFITVTRTDEDSTPPNVTVGNDLSRLTDSAVLKDRVYEDGTSTPKKAQPPLTMEAKQKQLEDKVSALRTKMAALMKFNQAREQSTP
jgi:hypothetical protein